LKPCEDYYPLYYECFAGGYTAGSYNPNAMVGGTSTCTGGCPDYAYAVDANEPWSGVPCQDSEWCQYCAPVKGCAPGNMCTAFCPPKTIWSGGSDSSGCGCSGGGNSGSCIPPTAPTCGDMTGLDYLDPSDEGSYPSGGYSICLPGTDLFSSSKKADCPDKDLGDGIVWEGTRVKTGDLWCLQDTGGTDYEWYGSCCAYCLPGKAYSPLTKSCE